MFLLRFLQFLLWLLQWLPYRWIRALATPLAALAWQLAGSRRRVTLVNLGLCFPDWTEARREQVARAHFRAFLSSMLSTGLQWFASRERLSRACQLVDLHHWDAVRDQPVILLSPHFMGLDIAGVRISADFPLISSYGKHKNPRADAIIYRFRTRFPRGLLFSRQDGVRPILRALKPPYAYYYLPDLDFGPKDSLFVPFFGVPTATVPALSRLAGLCKARVVPCIARERADGGGFEARFYPAWENFPSGDLDADTLRMNRFLEDRIRETPEQYLWTHKRFKTRPPGMPSVYGDDTR
jgi:Kdo2-lipid IVA lauroyltransferase/acyltransferase